MADSSEGRGTTGGPLAVVTSALLFGTGGVAIKATELGVGPLAAGRSAVAAAILWLVLPAWRGWNPKAFWVGIPFGATLVLFAAATKNTTAANAILLQSTAPLYAAFLGAWWLGEVTRPREAAWLAVAALGMGLFFVGTEPAQASAPAPALGNTIGACAGVTWALALVGLRWMAVSDPARAGDPSSTVVARDAAGQAVIAGNVWAVAMSVPLLGPAPAIAPVDIAVVLYLGVVQTALAYAFLTSGVRRVAAGTVSVLLLAEPPISAVLTWGVHGEHVSAWAAAGGALILVAAFARARLSAR